MITKNEGFWVDENFNMWNKCTQEEAQAKSNSLHNCHYCVNCEECIDCSWCLECKLCKDYSGAWGEYRKGGRDYAIS